VGMCARVLDYLGLGPGSLTTQDTRSNSHEVEE